MIGTAGFTRTNPATWGSQFYHPAAFQFGTYRFRLNGVAVKSCMDQSSYRLSAPFTLNGRPRGLALTPISFRICAMRTKLSECALAS